jgi:hypothetical protein
VDLKNIGLKSAIIYDFLALKRIFRLLKQLFLEFPRSYAYGITAFWRVLFCASPLLLQVTLLLVDVPG